MINVCKYLLSWMRLWRKSIHISLPYIICLHSHFQNFLVKLKMNINFFLTIDLIKIKCWKGSLITYKKQILWLYKIILFCLIVYIEVMEPSISCRSDWVSWNFREIILLFHIIFNSHAKTFRKCYSLKTNLLPVA